MSRLPGFLTKTLSGRLSLTIVSFIAILLSVALFIMLRYSRQAVKEEAMKNVEQTLDAATEQIDNILLNVEQTTGNVYWDILRHLDEPDRMFTYSRKIVETNPHIIGCAIAFEPYFYKEKGKYFMAYVHRSGTGELSTTDSPIIQDSIFGNRPYNEQSWYIYPMETGKLRWLGPMKSGNSDSDAIISFCLPLSGPDEQKVGILGVDVALGTLSEIIKATKPSPNSYCTLIGSDGAFIIHPDENKLLHQTAFTQTGQDPSVKKAVEAMLSGETGHRAMRLNGRDSYVFYKPFKRAAIQGRSTDELGWSVGIVSPKDDIFSDYNHLLYSFPLFAAVALLLLLGVCWAFAHRLLQPLRLLTKTAQRITEGHYDESVPDTEQQDEIGYLQNNFRQMQQSLAIHVNELERLTSTLQEQGEILQTALERAQEADRMKTAFLHNMTNQMATPVEDILTNAGILCDRYGSMEQRESVRMVNNIQRQGQVITILLNHLLDLSDQKKTNNQQ